METQRCEARLSLQGVVLIYLDPINGFLFILPTKFKWALFARYVTTFDSTSDKFPHTEHHH